jgi:hypothetical protein
MTAYRVLVGKPEGKKLLGVPRHRWENNIMAYLLKAGSVESEKQPLLCNGRVTRNGEVIVESGIFCEVRAVVI